MHYFGQCWMSLETKLKKEGLVLFFYIWHILCHKFSEFTEFFNELLNGTTWHYTFPELKKKWWKEWLKPEISMSHHNLRSFPAVSHREPAAVLWLIFTELFELLSVSLLLTATVCWRWKKNPDFSKSRPYLSICCGTLKSAIILFSSH